MECKSGDDGADIVGEISDVVPLRVRGHAVTAPVVRDDGEVAGQIRGETAPGRKVGAVTMHEHHTVWTATPHSYGKGNLAVMDDQISHRPSLAPAQQSGSIHRADPGS